MLVLQVVAFAKFRAKLKLSLFLNFAPHNSGGPKFKELSLWIYDNLDFLKGKHHLIYHFAINLQI